MARKSGRRSTVLAKEPREGEPEREEEKQEAPHINNPSTLTNVVGIDNKKQSHDAAPAAAAPLPDNGEVEVVRLSEEWIAPNKETFTKGSELRHVLCPLCLACDIADPVLLHDANPKSGLSCVACRHCVRRWLPVVECEAHSSAGVHCPLCDVALTGKDVTFQKELHLVGTLEETALPPLANQRLSSCAGEAGAGPAGLAVCGVCEEKKSPLLMCLQCNFALCEECRASTHAKGMFKTHEVVRMDQARKTSHAKRFCATHSGQNLELYCQTCAESVCVTCCFGGAHKGHDVVPLADIASDTKSQMHSIATELNVKSEASMTARDALAGLLPLHQTCVGQVEREIQDHFAALHQILKAREQSLLDRLLVHSKDMQQEMQQLVHVGAALSDSLRCSFTSLDGLIAALHPVALMEVEDAVQRACASMTSFTEATLDKLTAAQQVLKQKLSGEQERIAHFCLLPGQMGNEAALKEYQKVFASLGSLTAASRIRDLVDPCADEEEEEKGRAEETETDVETRKCIESKKSAEKGEATELQHPQQQHSFVRAEEKQTTTPSVRTLLTDTTSFSVAESAGAPSSSFQLSLQPLELSSRRETPLAPVNPNALPRADGSKLSLQEFQLGSAARRTEAHNVLPSALLQPLDPTAHAQASRKRPWSEGLLLQQEQQQHQQQPTPSAGGSLQLTWSPPTKVSRTAPALESAWGARQPGEENKEAPLEKTNSFLQLQL